MPDEQTRGRSATTAGRRAGRDADRHAGHPVTANLRTADIESAKGFYTDYLGLRDEEFNMGWVARYSTPRHEASVQLVTRDASAREDPVISVHTDDVEGAYAEARERGYEIMHPLTTEPWGYGASSSARRAAT